LQLFKFKASSIQADLIHGRELSNTSSSLSRVQNITVKVKIGFVGGIVCLEVIHKYIAEAQGRVRDEKLSTNITEHHFTSEFLRDWPNLPAVYLCFVVGGCCIDVSGQSTVRKERLRKKRRRSINRRTVACRLDVGGVARLSVQTVDAFVDVVCWCVISKL